MITDLKWSPKLGDHAVWYSPVLDAIGLERIPSMIEILREPYDSPYEWHDKIYFGDNFYIDRITFDPESYARIEALMLVQIDTINIPEIN